MFRNVMLALLVVIGTFALNSLAAEACHHRFARGLFRHSYARHHFSHQQVVAKASIKQQQSISAAANKPAIKDDQMARAAETAAPSKATEQKKDVAKVASKACHKFSAAIGGLVDTPCDTKQ